MPLSVTARVLPAVIAILVFAGCGREAPPSSSAAGSSQVSLGERDADLVTTEQPAVTCGDQYVAGKVIRFEKGNVGLLDPTKFDRYVEVPVDKIIGTLQVGDWARYELATYQPYLFSYVGTCAQFAFRPADPPPPPTSAELAKCGGWYEGLVAYYNANRPLALIEPLNGGSRLFAKPEVLKGKTLSEGASVLFRADGYGMICEIQA